ncbi:DUF1385 domain-containing protein, partial [Clostridioides difficile]|uniref:DUF1385 domain-containing protein n=1 Tax=Clostridioides difficile TaxID=1496 RepID=UPI001F436B6F
CLRVSSVSLSICLAVLLLLFDMILWPPCLTPLPSSAASDVYQRQTLGGGAFSKVMPNDFMLNLIEGIIRIAILFAYIVLISRSKDIERVFQYHGAEHKSIYCYENDLELTVENARKFKRLHPRCGTNFLFIVMAVSIILFAFFGWPNPILRIFMRIICVPIVAGLSYEVIRVLGKYDNGFTKIIAYPGMMLQYFTTKEPDDEQLEVALEALKAVVD